MSTEQTSKKIFSRILQSVSMEDITDADYAHSQSIFKKFRKIS